MTPITHNGWRLVDALGKPVLRGSVRPDFRGDCSIIMGGLCPHKDGSAGYVYTEAGREFFPSVYDLKWEKDEPVPPPGYTAEELEKDNPFNQWMHFDTSTEDKQ